MAFQPETEIENSHLPYPRIPTSVYILVEEPEDWVILSAEHEKLLHIVLDGMHVHVSDLISIDLTWRQIWTDLAWELYQH